MCNFNINKSREEWLKPSPVLSIIFHILGIFYEDEDVELVRVRYCPLAGGI